MKLFVVLALLAFTGCQANVLRLEEPEPQLYMVKDAFWDYVTMSTKAAQDALETIRESELGQEVSGKIKDSVDVARHYATILLDQASAIGGESYTKVSERVDWLSERLQQDLTEARAQLEPYTEQLWANVEQQAEKLREVVAPYIESLDRKALEVALRQKREELMKAVDWTVTKLEALLGPSAVELKEALEQRLQHFQQTVTSLTSGLRTEMSQRSHELEQTLTPYVDDLKEKLAPYIKDLDSRLSSIWETLTKTTHLGT